MHGRIHGVGNLGHCWQECKLVEALQKSLWRFLKNLKIEFPNDSAILFLGIYPKVHRSSNS
jgi:hypothetical protein